MLLRLAECMIGFRENRVLVSKGFALQGFDFVDLKVRESTVAASMSQQSTKAPQQPQSLRCLCSSRIGS